MVRFSFQEVFLIDCYTDTHWVQKQDTHNYLQIVFIEKGTGMHNVNGIDLPYKKKDIFLLTQDDEYTFKEEDNSVFWVFSFTDRLFSSRTALPDRALWLRNIDFILHYPELKPGPAIVFDQDQRLIWQVHGLIREELEQMREYYRDITANMVSSILSIISRNIKGGTSPTEEDTNEGALNIEDVLAHIHKYAHEPSKMKISSLAQTFKLTNSALSAYFKKTTGKSIHNYILRFKLDLVQHRLDNSEFTVSQIAHQLGFTDESHLTRIFKKYFNTTPKQYRKAV